MNKNLKVYCAGGWFNPSQNESLTAVERLLTDFPRIEPYLPRHDGVKLTPNELHDSGLRKKVFEDNVLHIDNSDLVVAVLDGREGFYDTGTLWEVGYAMSKGKTVIAYDPGHAIEKDLRSICNGFQEIDSDIESLDITLNEYIVKEHEPPRIIPSKVLFIGPDMTQDQRDKNQDIVASVIMECHGSNFRWVDDLSSEKLYNSIDEVFKNVDYMVSVIDDRHPVVSWMMGQAYNRGIPVITYTNFDYGVNIMLLCSLLYHCKGKEELNSIMQKMKRDGIYSLPKFDDSSLRAL